MIARAGLLLCGFAAALALGWLAPRLAAPEDRFGVAMALMDDGRGAEAALLLDDPIWRGVAEYRAGRFRRAEAGFVVGEDAAALYNLGTARARLFDYAGARTAFDAALRLEPDHADAAFNLDLVEKAAEAARRLADAARLARAVGAAAEDRPTRPGQAENDAETDGARTEPSDDPDRNAAAQGEEIASADDQDLGESRAADRAPGGEARAARGDLAETGARERRADGRGGATILRQSAAEAEALLRAIKDDPVRVLRARLLAIDRARKAAR